MFMSGERLAAARAALDITQEALAAHSETNQAVISQWERDLLTPTERTVRKVREALAKLKIVQQRLQERYPGVTINMSDIRFIRKELRKLDGGSKKIEQTWGADFIAKWCANGLTPKEFGMMAQLRAGVAEAELISAPCQRWIRASIAAIDVQLAGQMFDAYAARFGSRNEAITRLANDAFAALLAEVGKQKMLEDIQALLVTGELKAAPRDVEEN
jgi:transcriptional regulator with XRE-family HTH domain